MGPALHKLSRIKIRAPDWNIGSKENWNIVSITENTFHSSTVPAFHSTVPLFQHSTFPLFHFSTVPLFHFSTVPLFQHSTFPTFHCSTFPTFHCSTVPLFQYSCIPLHPFPAKPPISDLALRTRFSIKKNRPGTIGTVLWGRFKRTLFIQTVRTRRVGFFRFILMFLGLFPFVHGFFALLLFRLFLSVH